MEEEIKKDMKNGKKRKSVAGPIIASGLIGLAAGATMGLLFAPKPGKETRAIIASRAKQLNQASKETAHTVSHKAKEIEHAGKETMHTVSANIKGLGGHKAI
jgi:gas vesicle protein